jgi:NAD(P)-dependent dehydrogenase (short-subunit alcohol dehydrogenase family)
MANAPVALIIGCGDMGMGCARALGRRHPLMLIDIDTARLDKCVSALRHDGYSASGQSCDITDRAQLAQVGETLATTAGVKVLAHVAAIGNNGASWRKVIEVDLIAAQLVADAIGPHLVPGGAAIFISSTGAQRCPRDERLYTLLDDPLHPDLCDHLHDLAGREPNFLEAYFMAKQGVNRLAERLAIKWGGRQVRTLSVSPGLIDSTMGRTGGERLPIYDGSGETRLGSRSEKARIEVPLRRQGSLLEVIAAVDFLASDAASFISGIDVPVDGGSSAYWRSSGDAVYSAEMEEVALFAAPKV